MVSVHAPVSVSRVTYEAVGEEAGVRTNELSKKGVTVSGSVKMPCQLSLPLLWLLQLSLLPLPLLPMPMSLPLLMQAPMPMWVSMPAKTMMMRRRTFTQIEAKVMHGTRAWR